jgi:hypothetical protein
MEKFAPAIRQPAYYKTSFSVEELALIRTETAETARRWRLAEPKEQ